VVYLSKEDVMLMHGVLMRQFGGHFGLRDEGALEAALYRPQSGYYPDLISQAAALFESLAVNHPFIDGNKRIDFAVMDRIHFYARIICVLTRNQKISIKKLFKCLNKKSCSTR